VKLIGKLQDGTVFLRKGHDEGDELFEFKTDDGKYWSNIAEGFWAGSCWGVLGFLLWLGLCRFFFLFFLPFLFVFLYTYCILRRAYAFLKISLITYKKEEKKLLE
jgi:hypothetical protein